MSNDRLTPSELENILYENKGEKYWLHVENTMEAGIYQAGGYKYFETQLVTTPFVTTPFVTRPVTPHFFIDSSSEGRRLLKSIEGRRRLKLYFTTHRMIWNLSKSNNPQKKAEYEDLPYQAITTFDKKLYDSSKHISVPWLSGSLVFVGELSVESKAGNRVFMIHTKEDLESAYGVLRMKLVGA